MQNVQRAKNLILISVAPTNQLIQKRYYDLPGTIELMRVLCQASVIDGFEFQNLAEWDDQNPPRDERERRLGAWNESQKYTINEIVSLLQEAKLPILSVHANRDIGVCLCSGQKEDIDRGKQLIHESLYLAEKVGASVCVFHLWDTYKEAFDLRFLQNVLHAITSQYPHVKASIENVPTYLAGSTPFELVRQSEWITLDLQWAALSDEFEKFESVKERIANVHLRGHLEGSKWMLNRASFGFYEALDIIINQWGYSGLLTMEPTGLHDGDWENLVAAMSTLRNR